MPQQKKKIPSGFYSDLLMLDTLLICISDNFSEQLAVNHQMVASHLKGCNENEGNTFSLIP